MNLFIQMKDGKPFEHPILEDNMRMLFEDFNPDIPPEGFAKFERVDMKLSPYDIFTPSDYFVDVDGIVRNGTKVAMTTEQKAEKIQQAQTYKPFPSWIFNEENYRWDPPTAIPDATKPYYWNEPTQEWLLYDQEKQI